MPLTPKKGSFPNHTSLTDRLNEPWQKCYLTIDFPIVCKKSGLWGFPVSTAWWYYKSKFDFHAECLCHCLICQLERSEIYILRIVDCASRGSTSPWALQLLVLGALLISLRPELLRAPPSLQITFWGKKYKKLFCRKKFAQELNSSFLQLLNCFTTLLLQHYYLHHKYRP